MHPIVRAPKHSELVNNSTLYVIGVLENSVRYHTRFRLFEEWVQRMKATPNVKLVLVELAFGDRHHECDPQDPDITYIKVRGNSELFHKENMINIALRALPPDYSYACICDTDIAFENEDWALETIHQLQVYPVVQPFEQCADMTARGSILQVHQSFGKLHATGVKMQRNAQEVYQHGHPGYALAFRKEVIEAVGGRFLDSCILGSGDHSTILAMVGRASDSFPQGVHKNYEKIILDWEKKIFKVVNGDIGYTEGSIKHFFHGPKQAFRSGGKEVGRAYISRWKILLENQFDPEEDIYYNKDGIIELTGSKPKLTNDIRSYLRARREDSREED